MAATAAQQDPRPACPTWADHAWSSPRLVETGQDPARGRFQTWTMECRACGRRTTRTDWITTPRRQLRGLFPMEDEQ